MNRLIEYTSWRGMWEHVFKYVLLWCVMWGILIAYISLCWGFEIQSTSYTLQSYPVCTTTPTDGQFVQYDTGQYCPATIENLTTGNLKNINSPTDEYCLSYEATGDGIEYVPCGTPGSLARKCKTFTDPMDADAPPFWIAGAWTVSKITYFCSGGTSVVFTLQECDNYGANCVAVEAAITCTSGNATGAVDAVDIDNPSLDDGDIIRLDIGTVTGTVEYIMVCMEPTL